MLIQLQYIRYSDEIYINTLTRKVYYIRRMLVCTGKSFTHATI